MRQSGEPVTRNAPWCSRKVNSDRAGYSSAVRGAHDQTHETIGTMKWCTKYGVYRPAVRKSPRVTAPPSAPARLVAVQELLGGPVEPLDLDQHAHELRLEDVGRLGEDAAHAPGARVLEAAPVAAHRHAHVGGLGLHAELAEQPEQVGVRAQVVHDEATVDREEPAVAGDDVVGVRVPTETGLGLVQA